MDGVKINGNRIPWSVALVLGTVIAHGSVTYYKVEKLNEAVGIHHKLPIHSQAHTRLIVLELKVEQLLKEREGK